MAASASGTLMYLPGQSTTSVRPVQWIDRDGHATPLWVPPANWFNIHVAPDGPPAILFSFSGRTSDIWVYEQDRDTARPLTRHPAGDDKAVWTPDGRRIVFNSSRDAAPRSIYWQRADGTGDAERLTVSKNSQWPISWHPSGKFLTFEEETPRRAGMSMILPMEGDEASGWRAGTPVPFLNSPAAEKEPNFSPDGRWVAYQSNETGRDEIYVRPFQRRGDGWRISS